MLHNLYEIKVPLIQKKEVAVSLKIWGDKQHILKGYIDVSKLSDIRLVRKSESTETYFL